MNLEDNAFKLFFLLIYSLFSRQDLANSQPEGAKKMHACCKLAEGVKQQMTVGCQSSIQSDIDGLTEDWQAYCTAVSEADEGLMVYYTFVLIILYKTQRPNVFFPI